MNAMFPSLAGIPILIVTAEVSAFSIASPPTADFLNAAGASVELLHLQLSASTATATD